MRNRKVLKNLITEKTNLLELVIVAISIGLSIEMISNGISEVIQLNGKQYLLIGIGILILSVLYFLIKLAYLRETENKYEGFVSYKVDEKSIIPVYRYRYSENIYEDLKCAFNENPALKKIWESGSLSPEMKINDDGTGEIKISRAGNLIVQATEYFIIKELSLHLSTFYNKKKSTKIKLNSFRERIYQVFS